MTDWIIGKENFNKNLNAWLEFNDQKASDFLFKNRNKIPPIFRSFSGKLYRGMSIPDYLYDEIMSKGLTFNSHTSWAKDMKVAKGFVNDPKYSIAKKGENVVKILITKTISSNNQILDIDGFVNFMGVPQLEMQGYDELALDSASNEREVLIQKGIKITKTNVKII